jgi:4-diphosphocytidyl-2-C-methyl-D-erythritol kinase
LIVVRKIFLPLRSEIATMRAAGSDFDRSERRALGRGRPPRFRSSGPPRQSVTVLAHAKVNLTLEVVGRRTDGFHDIRSWMIPLVLADRLEIQRLPKGVQLEVPGLPELRGKTNLVHRAAVAFQRHFGRPSGVRLTLTKRIPITAGLGGGSSDAAATLRGLAQLEGIRDPEALHALATDLGSDVPFFLSGGAAFVSGRGERVEEAPPPPPCWLLLVKPPFGITAAEAYAAWRPGARRPTLTGHGAGANWTEFTSKRLRIRTAKGVGASLTNDLQPGALRMHPRLRSVLGRLSDLSPLGVAMSGSGPTCFAIFASRGQAERAAKAFRSQPAEELLVTRPLRGPARSRPT